MGLFDRFKKKSKEPLNRSAENVDAESCANADLVCVKEDESVVIRLVYKQLGRGSVKESQKIYYCAAPDDYEKFFDSIAASLATCYPDISLWYPTLGGTTDHDTSKETEDYLFDLSQMNLFVIPVTQKFLMEKNRARDTEFAFAIKNHIPVLPILEEPGLEELFNKQCGYLQCLSVVDSDATALPFETKLKTYLDSVLLRDETLTKIRESFGGYIFLSYRKKDRTHAQEVMRLIHRTPSCRDVAIWYDEFLTPGEDFNDSIRQAFDRSSLFALVVTPNILEDGNYVMEQEYPMAVDAGRPIMPVVAVDTDDSSLEVHYPGIPERWRCSDEYVDLIADKVRTELTLKFNDDPEHRYYIGLAYLNGVDLEVDSERALSLISLAAAEGVDEAYKKLVDMYRTGTGVERDYYEAAKWSESYAEHLEKQLLDTVKRAADQRYVSAWLEAGKNWEFVMEDEKALRAYEKSLSGKMTAGDIASYVYQMESCYNAVLLAVRMKEYELSKEFCNRYFTACNYCSVFDIYKIRAEELAGFLAYRSGKWDEAIIHFENGLELVEDFEEDNSDLVYFKHMKAQFCQFLGSSYFRMGADIDRAGIVEYFEQALALFNEIENQKFDGTDESRIMIYHSLGEINRSRGDDEAAAEYARKAMELATVKDKEEGSLFSKRTRKDAMRILLNTSGSHGNGSAVSDFAELPADPVMMVELTAKGEDGDIESLQRAYDGYCLLAKYDAEDQLYVSERNRIEVMLADEYYKRGMNGDIAMLERALIMDDALSARLGYPECNSYLDRLNEEREQLAHMYRDAAEALKSAGKPADIRVDMFIRAYEAYKALLDEKSNDAEWGKTYDAMAEQAAFDSWECGRKGEPIRLIRAYELFREISEKHPEKQSCQIAIRSVEDALAFLYFGWGKTDPRFMESSLAMYKHLLERDPENERLKKNVRAAEKRVAKHKLVSFIKGNSSEKRQAENILQGILGQKVDMNKIVIDKQ